MQDLHEIAHGVHAVDLVFVQRDAELRFEGQDELHGLDGIEAEDVVKPQARGVLQLGLTEDRACSFHDPVDQNLLRHERFPIPNVPAIDRFWETRDRNGATITCRRRDSTARIATLTERAPRAQSVIITMLLLEQTSRPRALNLAAADSIMLLIRTAERKGV